MLKIRQAKESEMDWVNKCYDQVQFMHSIFDKELIAVAEWDDQKIGLGRLVTIDKDNLELGGMYVMEAYRGQGVAREIVSFLLKEASPSKNIYCLAFQHLVPFYSQYGFVPCEELKQIPQEFGKKFQWCQRTYTATTALLILKK